MNIVIGTVYQEKSIGLDFIAFGLLKILFNMSKLKTAIELIRYNRKIFFRTLYESLRHTKLLRVLSDSAYIKLTYKVYFNKTINLDFPRTFNEKLNWLKLNYRLPIMKQLVDKYEVKKYVSQRIGEHYVIQTLGVWENYESIDINSLPEKFVLKGTHDSSSVILCRDKLTFDLTEYKKQLIKSLSDDLYHWGREWPYKCLKKRIIAEPLLEDSSGLRDYKFFCFNGKMKCFKIDFDRFVGHRANYYDENLNLMTIGEVVCPPDFRDYSMPDNLGEMIALAESLAEGFPFVRVDFYNVQGKIYFGEMTFYPAAGFGQFTKEDDDILLGSWIKLPNQKVKHPL